MRCKQIVRTVLAISLALFLVTSSHAQSNSILTSAYTHFASQFEASLLSGTVRLTSRSDDSSTTETLFSIKHSNGKDYVFSDKERISEKPNPKSLSTFDRAHGFQVVMPPGKPLTRIRYSIVRGSKITIDLSSRKILDPHEPRMIAGENSFYKSLFSGFDNLPEHLSELVKRVDWKEKKNSDESIDFTLEHEFGVTTISVVEGKIVRLNTKQLDSDRYTIYSIAKLRDIFDSILGELSIGLSHVSNDYKFEYTKTTLAPLKKIISKQEYHAGKHFSVRESILNVSELRTHVTWNDIEPLVSNTRDGMPIIPSSEEQALTPLVYKQGDIVRAVDDKVISDTLVLNRKPFWLWRWYILGPILLVIAITSLLIVRRFRQVTT